MLLGNKMHVGFGEVIPGGHSLALKGTSHLSQNSLPLIHLFSPGEPSSASP